MNKELLPPSYWNDDIYTACERIGERHHLTLNQVGEMDASIRDFLDGYVGHGYFVLHLLNRINTKSCEHAQPITEATAERIEADIKSQLLAPIREILGSVHPDWLSWLSG